MLFIWEKRVYFKVVWGIIIVMELINIIGSASSGGFLGMFFVVTLGVIMLNRRIITWWKSVSVLVVLAVIVGGVTHVYMTQAVGRSWLDEVGQAVRGSVNSGQAAEASLTDSTPARTKIDYFINDGFDIIFSIDGNEATITIDPENKSIFTAKDSEGKELTLTSTQLAYDRDSEEATNPAYLFTDPRFSKVQLFPASSGTDEENSEIIFYCLFRLTDHEMEWPFAIRADGVYYHNQLRKYVKLEKIPSVGWTDNPGFGSGRGYIWSRTIPMISKTIVVGHGADTFCVYFPHKDYVGKYNAGWNINTIVDKPHNMYFASAVGTGLISTLTLIALFLMYAIQCIQIYWKDEYNDFSSITGVGVFLGVMGFVISGFVDDSTVSVMPMFYGLLALGIAINIMVARKRGIKKLIFK
jgi:hypothetical protein